MKEEQLREHVSRGQEAQKVLDNPIVKLAFTHLKTATLSAMKKTKGGPKGDEDRQELHRLLLTVDRFESIFQRLVRDGELAEKQLLREPKLRNIKLG